MRTADKIIRDYIGWSDTEVGYPGFDINSISLIGKIVNKARKEAIEECAERAKSEWIRYGTNMGHAVDKQSILSLINELK